MLENILNGELPSSVFKRLVAADATLNNIALSNFLSNEFVDLSSEAAQLVWHWKAPGKSHGLTDENLDSLLLKLFEDAGYL